MGETFVLPEAGIDEQVMIVPGTDGEKMSKSRNNLLRIFAPEKELKKEVMGIVTDSTPMEEPKDPEGNTVYQLFRLVAPADAVTDMATKFRAGGYGYGHAKKALLEVLLDGFRTERETFDRLMTDPAELDRQLKIGADKARNVASGVLKRVREKLGY
jgi:tryptophanyl-tRNA synthetase